MEGEYGLSWNHKNKAGRNLHAIVNQDGSDKKIKTWVLDLARRHYIERDTFPVDPDRPWRAGGESGAAQRARPSNYYQGIGNPTYRQSSGSSSSSRSWSQSYWHSHPCT